MQCKERIEELFRENGVGYEVMTHPEVYTMQETAAALHVSGKQVAKVVIVKADEQKVMLVVPAPNRLNLEKVKTLLEADRVALSKESEFSSLFSDCLPGAMPPFGHLYQMPVYVDESLAEQDVIVFRVGTHRHSMKITYADYARLANPIEGSFTWLV
ncbi:MAG: YbaK/EbsC family protein [Anaerolineales bacterium]|nr:YbaK/EbsC family protein [Anaerolineales bacterium]